MSYVVAWGMFQMTRVAVTVTKKHVLVYRLYNTPDLRHSITAHSVLRLHGDRRCHFVGAGWRCTQRIAVSNSAKARWRGGEGAVFFTKSVCGCCILWDTAPDIRRDHVGFGHIWHNCEAEVSIVALHWWEHAWLQRSAVRPKIVTANVVEEPQGGDIRRKVTALRVIWALSSQVNSGCWWLTEQHVSEGHRRVRGHQMLWLLLRLLHRCNFLAIWWGCVTGTSTWSHNMAHDPILWWAAHYIWRGSTISKGRCRNVVIRCRWWCTQEPLLCVGRLIQNRWVKHSGREVAIVRCFGVMSCWQLALNTGACNIGIIVFQCHVLSARLTVAGWHTNLGLEIEDCMSFKPLLLLVHNLLRKWAGTARWQHRRRRAPNCLAGVHGWRGAQGEPRLVSCKAVIASEQMRWCASNIRWPWKGEV